MIYTVYMKMSNKELLLGDMRVKFMKIILIMRHHSETSAFPD